MSDPTDDDNDNLDFENTPTDEKSQNHDPIETIRAAYIAQGKKLGDLEDAVERLKEETENRMESLLRKINRVKADVDDMRQRIDKYDIEKLSP